MFILFLMNYHVLSTLFICSMRCVINFIPSIVLYLCIICILVVEFAVGVYSSLNERSDDIYYVINSYYKQTLEDVICTSDVVKQIPRLLSMM